MALIERLPPDPKAIDIGAIQRREALEIWKRNRDRDAAELDVRWAEGWKGWLRRWH